MSQNATKKTIAITEEEFEKIYGHYRQLAGIVELASICDGGKMSVDNLRALLKPIATGLEDWYCEINDRRDTGGAE